MFIKRVLRIFVNESEHDTLIGDLLEFYDIYVKEKGRFTAGLWLWTQLIKTLPIIVKTETGRKYSMIKNYLKIAIRNLLKNKIYSGINILGLSVGLACCILLLYFINDEVNYDRFHEKADQIYEVYSIIDAGSYTINLGSELPLAPALIEEFPEVENSSRIFNREVVVIKGINTLKQKGYAIDPSFFDIFSFNIMAGDKSSMLTNPGSILLTESTVSRLFNQDDPIGETVTVLMNDQKVDFNVTGIVEDAPENSSIKFDFFINIKDVFGDQLLSWDSGKAVPTIILISNKDAAGNLESKFENTIDKRNEESYTHKLQSLTGYHLDGRYSALMEGKSGRQYSYLLGAIALLILFIACFNFMNLSIGNSANRIKEIGIRKVMGAQKKQLIKQFWFESVIISTISMVIGMFLAELFLPAFNSVSGKTINILYFSGSFIIIELVVIAILTGMLAGFYPAFVLSGFKAVNLFRREFKFTGNNKFSRFLLVVQFGIAVFLIITSLLMYNQYSFLINKDIGLEKENVVIIPISEILPENYRTEAVVNSFRTDLMQNPAVINAGGSLYGLTTFLGSTIPKDKDGNRVLVDVNSIDFNYMKTLGIKILGGKGFDPDERLIASNSVLVNETFLNRFEVENPIGTKLTEYLKTDDLTVKNPFLEKTIIGVFRDFHYQVLHRKINPTVLEYSQDKLYGAIIVKISKENVSETLVSIKNSFEKVAPGYPMMYTFLDTDLQDLYTLESRWNRIVMYSTYLAVILSVSGLFGLTLLSLNYRERELSIRKVLGASVRGLTYLVNKEFLILIVAANIIAWPAAYYTMRKILENYAYAAEINIWIFVMAFLIVLGVSILTISLQAFKTVIKNPAETLKAD